MYDQHVTREQQGETLTHLSAVSDAPQTDSEAGAVREDCENTVEDNSFADAAGDVSVAPTERVPVDAGAAYVGHGPVAARDAVVDSGTASIAAVPELDDEAADSDDDDDEDSNVVAPIRAAQPMLSIVGFDQMFEEIEDQWQERALCAQTDPEAFFPEKGGSTREAKRICLGCEVKDECLEYALANDERFGIWGGLSERERRRLKRGIV